MAKSTSLQALELRRRLLLAESELNRLELREDLAQMSHATRWLGDLLAGANSLRSNTSGGQSWMTLAAPVAGVLAAGSLLKRGTVVGRISALVKLAAVAYPVIKAWQRHRKSARVSPGLD